MRRLSKNIQRKLSGPLTRLASFNLKLANKGPLDFDQITSTSPTQTSETDVSKAANFGWYLKNKAKVFQWSVGEDPVRRFETQFQKLRRTLNAYAQYLDITLTKNDIMSFLGDKDTPQEKERENIVESFESAWNLFSQEEKKEVLSTLQKNFQGFNIDTNVFKSKFKYPGFGDNDEVADLLLNNVSPDQMKSFNMLGNFDLINYYFHLAGRNLFAILESESESSPIFSPFAGTTNSNPNYTTRPEITEQERDILTGKMGLDDIVAVVWAELGRRGGSQSNFSKLFDDSVPVENPGAGEDRTINFRFDELSGQGANPEIRQKYIQAYVNTVKSSSQSSITGKIRQLRECLAVVKDNKEEIINLGNNKAAILSFLDEKTENNSNSVYILKNILSPNIEEGLQQSEKELSFLEDCAIIRKSLEVYNKLTKADVFSENENYLKEYIKKLVDTNSKKEVVCRNLNDEFFKKAKTPEAEKEVRYKIISFFNSLTGTEGYSRELNMPSDSKAFASELNNTSTFEDFIQKLRERFREQDLILLLHNPPVVETLKNGSRVLKMNPMSNKAAKVLDSCIDSGYAKKKAEMLRELKDPQSDLSRLKRRIDNAVLAKRTMTSLSQWQNRRTRTHTRIVREIGSFGGSVQAKVGEYGIERLTQELKSVTNQWLAAANYYEKNLKLEDNLEKFTGFYAKCKEDLPTIIEDITSKIQLIGSKSKNVIITKKNQEPFLRALDEIIEYGPKKDIVGKLRSQINSAYRSDQALKNMINTSNSFGNLLHWSETGPELNESFVLEHGQKVEYWQEFVKTLRELDLKLARTRDLSIDLKQAKELDSKITEIEELFSTLTNLAKNLKKRLAWTKEDSQSSSELSKSIKEIKDETSKKPEPITQTKPELELKPIEPVVQQPTTTPTTPSLAVRDESIEDIFNFSL